MENTALKETFIVTNNKNSEPLLYSFNADKIPSRIIIEKHNYCEILINDFLSEQTLDIDIQEGANLKLSLLLENQINQLKITAKLHKNSKIDVYYADFSKGRNASNIQIDLLEKGSSAFWHLASLSAEHDYKEISVDLNHLAEDTFGKVDNYGVCKDNAQLVFSGTSKICKGSHHSKTSQNAKIVVFDSAAHARAKPILKIDENDIEASHSAGLGKINEDHLFYLTSRGITTLEARQLITMGYLKPILAGFSQQDYQTKIMSLIERRL